MTNEINEIAQRIKELREVCGYSAEELAKELGVDVKEYEKYEETGDIPISTIYHIANKFNVDFTEIVTGVRAKLDTYHLIRKGNGKDVSRFPGYRYEDLAFRYSHKIMQPLLVTLEPSDEPAALVTHSGQEFNMVLEGTIILTFDDTEIELSAGDCIYFNPTYPHGQKCAGDTAAKFLTVIAE